MRIPERRGSAFSFPTSASASASSTSAASTSETYRHPISSASLRTRRS